MSMTSDLLDRLKRHYLKPGERMPGGVFIPECGRNGGFGAGSRCDALYVGFTSASGRLLVGHELKVSRADWLHELDQPGKADVWADDCHEWWLVVPDAAIVHEGELPAGWGLITPSARSKNRMQVVVAAVRHVDRVPSWTSVRSMFARLDTIQRQERDEIERQAKLTLDAKVSKRLEERAEQSLTSKQAMRLGQLDRIEKALGATVEWSIDGNCASPEEMATAMKLSQILTKALGYNGFGSLARDLRNAAKALDRAEAEIAELKAGDPA